MFWKPRRSLRRLARASLMAPAIVGRPEPRAIDGKARFHASRTETVMILALNSLISLPVSSRVLTMEIIALSSPAPAPPTVRLLRASRIVLQGPTALEDKCSSVPMVVPTNMLTARNSPRRPSYPPPLRAINSKLHKFLSFFLIKSRRTIHLPAKTCQRSCRSGCHRFSNPMYHLFLFPVSCATADRIVLVRGAVYIKARRRQRYRVSLHVRTLPPATLVSNAP